MKTRLLTLLCGVTGSLIAGGPASAAYIGLVVVDQPNEFGILACSVYAVFDNPNDHLLAVAGTQIAPLLVEAPGSFYQHPFGGDLPPHPALVEAFPSLEFDTFVGIGIRINTGGDPDATTIPNGWPGFSSTRLETASFGHGWFVTPDDAQGAPDPNGLVFIGQFSTLDSSRPPGGHVIIEAISDGEPILVAATFCHGLASPCIEGDTNGDTFVDIVDFLTVLRCWEQPQVGACEFADVDRDGETGIADFLLVLGRWTGSPTIPPPLPDDVDADLDGDGLVGIIDLLWMLTGFCPDEVCDLDGNGELGMRDFLILLANWD